MGPHRFNSARFVLPPHLSAIVGLPARPTELRTRKTFDVCRTRMTQCMCIDGPLRQHVASGWRSSERKKKLSNWLAASSFFQSFRCDQRRPSPISQLICQISQLIFDRNHVNASHDVPTCKVIDLWTMDRLCVRGHNGRVGGQRKWIMESENAFRFPLIPSLAVWGWTINPSYLRSTLDSPCVAVFIQENYWRLMIGCTHSSMRLARSYTNL